MSLAAEYLETQVMTATPHRLHLMVVDAALRNTRRGLEMLSVQKWEELDRSLGKARECVAELISGLNPEMAPELVESFRALFGFVYRSLTVGDLERDSKALLDAMRILLLHRENWVALGERLMQDAAVDGATESPKFAEPGAIPAPHGRSWSA